MPTNPFVETFEHFENLVVDLNIQWQMFDELFSEPENHLLFRKSGAAFFLHLREYLSDLLCLSISRFFDPPQSSGRDNLSIKALLAYFELDPVRNELTTTEVELRAKWENGIRTWRHKRLAHSDLETAFSGATLPAIPYADIQYLVEGISRLSRKMRQCGCGTDVHYKIHMREWIPVLLRQLRKAEDQGPASPGSED